MNYQIGDNLYVRYLGYEHHGIYIGNGNVIHYSKEDYGVYITSLIIFYDERKAYIKEHSERKYSREISVERALSRVGEDNYDVFSNNCEHFVNWCIYGIAYSEQVEEAERKALELLMKIEEEWEKSRLPPGMPPKRSPYEQGWLKERSLFKEVCTVHEIAISTAKTFLTPIGFPLKICKSTWTAGAYLFKKIF